MKKFFEGWYHKHQANGKTLAIIPGKADDGAFIHVIADNGSATVPFDLSEYRKDGILAIGDNQFSDSGILLNIERDGFSIHGELKYSGLVPIRGDIMGIFRFFPMECRHGIVSMKHDVHGEIVWNNEKYKFEGGTGYIETDSGSSFPDSYSWVHSNDFTEPCSITAAVARIPFAGMKFWGCFCVVWYKGREYRLATYRGAKILCCENGIIELGQGKYRLSVKVKRENAFCLPAPKLGSMNRIIKESPSCPTEFNFTVNGRTIFSAESRHTSYEFAR